MHLRLQHLYHHLIEKSVIIYVTTNCIPFLFCGCPEEPIRPDNSREPFERFPLLGGRGAASWSSQRTTLLTLSRWHGTAAGTATRFPVISAQVLLLFPQRVPNRRSPHLVNASGILGELGDHQDFVASAPTYSKSLNPSRLEILEIFTSKTS